MCAPPPLAGGPGGVPVGRRGPKILSQGAKFRQPEVHTEVQLENYRQYAGEGSVDRGLWLNGCEDRAGTWHAGGCHQGGCPAGRRASCGVLVRGPGGGSGEVKRPTRRVKWPTRYVLRPRRKASVARAPGHSMASLSNLACQRDLGACVFGACAPSTTPRSVVPGRCRI